MDKHSKLKAGHYEVQGETIAKFEFFENGFNPYSRYLDVDKVDLILRKREGKSVRYIEIQVKFGRLYHCDEKWAKLLFEYTCWKMFKLDSFEDHRSSLFIALVLSGHNGYKGDIFIFPSKVFHELIKIGIQTNTKRGKQSKIYIAKQIDNERWYLWKKRNIDVISEHNTLDVTEYRRNFKQL